MTKSPYPGPFDPPDWHPSDDLRPIPQYRKVTPTIPEKGNAGMETLLADLAGWAATIASERKAADLLDWDDLEIIRKLLLRARAALHAGAEGVEGVEGWQPVPKEPTGEMLANGRDAIEPYVQRGLSKPVSDQWQIARETYRAMLAADPSPLPASPPERRDPTNEFNELYWDGIMGSRQLAPSEPLQEAADLIELLQAPAPEGETALHPWPMQVQWSDEDKGFIATVPLLPGCSAFGVTAAEAFNEIGDAIIAWLEAAAAAGNQVPSVACLPLPVEPLQEALRTALVAINDWVATYAPDQCTDEHRDETKHRIMHAGGTLAYTARVSATIRAALSPKEP